MMIIFIMCTWVKFDGEAVDDESGKSVSLSSDGPSGGNDDNGNLSGHVRVYTLENDTWVQIGQDIDGEAQLDFSGESVS